VLTYKQKATLQELRPNYVVSRNDNRYWQKVLRFEPQNAEAMYYVGLDLEAEAITAMRLYRETGLNKHLASYRVKSKRAYDLLQRSWRNGFALAGKAVTRVKGENRRRQGEIERMVLHNRGTSKAEWLAVAILFAILMVLIALLFSPFRIYVFNAFARTELVAAAIPAVTVDSSRNAQGAKIQAGSALVSASQDYLLWEAATVLRSALYQFVQRNGYFPDSLTALTESFPNNYLTAIPKEPNTQSNLVLSSPNDQGGGWVYRKPESDWPLLIAVQQAIQPNRIESPLIPFAPIAVQIDKSTNRLGVLSGDVTLRSYPVALGRNSSTPEGDLFINRKVSNPNQSVPLSKNPYGTRALELSNTRFAIHGTNNPESIGQNVSHGCIRLNNEHAEEVYAMVPLFSPVHIGNAPLPVKAAAETQSGLYTKATSPKEEDRTSKYTWGK
jgi:lipoprotein-anchoring transpeptidase ErfK/SrfK